MNRQTFVIVGASLAGASAAAALRKEGFDGRIVLIGEEAERPYERPELSKKYLRAEPGTELAVHDPDFYAAADIELMTGLRVEAVDVHRREVRSVTLRFPFDRLLLTTGSTPRRLDVPGSDLDGVLTLRTQADSDRIRESASKAQDIVVVGGGWIGSEVAASLRQLDRSVTVILPSDVPLQRVVGPEVGSVYRDVHLANGVQIVKGRRVIGLRGRGAVESVELDDGRTLAADLVICGLGASPRTELASDAGLRFDGGKAGAGIAVDARLESSVPGVFAAGDVAAAWHPLYRRNIRVEHWDNAKRQGRFAAGAMLGRTDQYERIPYFYSDQFDLGMEYTGFAPQWDEVVFRGEPLSRKFIAFWLLRGKVVAGMNMNTWDVAPSIERLVRAQATVEREALADPARPLDELTPVPVAA